MYEIEYTAEALDDLAYFRKHEQVLIVEEIERRLQDGPTTPNRNRKELRPNSTATWELRIGNFRVFYNPNEIIQVVGIARIGEKRGNTVFFRGKRGEL